MGLITCTSNRRNEQKTKVSEKKSTQLKRHSWRKEWNGHEAKYIENVENVENCTQKIEVFASKSKVKEKKLKGKVGNDGENRV